MSRRLLLGAVFLTAAFAGLSAPRAAQAQDYTDYLHWPYTPPQANGGAQLYDGWYLYPREQRIVPQIQGPYYRNYYGGKRRFGMRHPNDHREWNNKKFYSGYHYFLDVF